MSQRECAGFNWPGFAVSAGDPVGVGPEASRACSFSGRAFSPQRSRVAPFQSRAAGFVGDACGATSNTASIRFERPVSMRFA
jgi:hypothetical protein